MKRLVSSFIILLAVMTSQSVNANSALAKQVLSQNTTNPFCPAGNNNPGSDDQYEQFKKDQFEGSCPQGMGYVDCLRQFWKTQPK